METKRTIELLEIIRFNLSNNIGFNWETTTGICQAIQYLRYSDVQRDEQHLLRDFIYQNKPTPTNQFKAFVDTPFWYDRGFWWGIIERYPYTRQIRIEYLTALINSLK